ncbi:MAG TPA: rhodanese-like domain-containing protein [Planctomycetota bacterium]|nr:rhodanese-like domain-containing protein [Planctomycetota bacterium]
MDITEIDVEQALIHLQDGDALFMDVRDPDSFGAGHLPGAVNVNDATIPLFLTDTARDRKIIVYCYHGHMSMGGAAYLSENDFDDVASMRGGFSCWTGPTEKGA